MRDKTRDESLAIYRIPVDRPTVWRGDKVVLRRWEAVGIKSPGPVLDGSTANPMHGATETVLERIGTERFQTKPSPTQSGRVRSSLLVQQHEEQFASRGSANNIASKSQTAAPMVSPGCCQPCSTTPATPATSPATRMTISTLADLFIFVLFPSLTLCSRVSCFKSGVTQIPRHRGR